MFTPWPLGSLIVNAVLTPTMEWLHRLRIARSSPCVGIFPSGQKSLKNKQALLRNWKSFQRAFHEKKKKNISIELLNQGNDKITKKIRREIQIVVDSPKICFEPVWIIGSSDEEDTLSIFVVIRPAMNPAVSNGVTTFHHDYLYAMHKHIHEVSKKHKKDLCFLGANQALEST